MKKLQEESLFVLPEKKKKIWLSHSGIESGNRCKRCFYLQYKHKIYQPEGIQSRLANRFDTVLKAHCDSYRKLDTLPPMLQSLGGKLQNPFKEAYFHSINDEFGLYGKLDECLVDPAGNHIPVDFKTSSSDPREKDILPAYYHQIDTYTFLLEKNRLNVAGFGYLVFFYPDLIHEDTDGFPMVQHVVKIDAHPEQVEGRVREAITTLSGSLPPSSPSCTFCSWFEKVKNYFY